MKWHCHKYLIDNWHFGMLISKTTAVNKCSNEHLGPELNCWKQPKYVELFSTQQNQYTWWMELYLNFHREIDKFKLTFPLSESFNLDIIPWAPLGNWLISLALLWNDEKKRDRGQEKSVRRIFYKYRNCKNVENVYKNN